MLEETTVQKSSPEQETSGLNNRKRLFNVCVVKMKTSPTIGVALNLGKFAAFMYILNIKKLIYFVNFFKLAVENIVQTGGSHFSNVYTRVLDDVLKKLKSSQNSPFFL